MALTKVTGTGLETLSDGVTITVDDNSDTLTLTSTDADANIGPNVRFYRNSATPADDDLVGGIVFDSRNDNSQDIQPVRIRAYTSDVSDGTEDGGFDIATMTNGALSNRMDFLPTETIFNNSSIDVDFRVESDTDANALFVDGETGKTTVKDLGLGVGGGLRGEGAITVGTSATNITAANDMGTLCIVAGNASGAIFSDLVFFATTLGATVVAGGTVSGGPAGRTYSVVSSKLKLAMASGSYSVKATAFHGTL
jgi:hypothetical protein